MFITFMFEIFTVLVTRENEKSDYQRGEVRKRGYFITLRSNPAHVFTSQSSQFHQFWFSANFQVLATHLSRSAVKDEQSKDLRDWFDSNLIFSLLFPL
jgi:hypothetical protein